MIEFRMPSLGADMKDGTLRDWNVKTGDVVKRGDIIAVVETQKGLIEIETFDAGTIKELLIKEDEKVPVGTVMALIEPSEKDSAAKPVAGAQEKITSPQTPEKIITGEDISLTIQKGIKVSPLAKKIATENKIDLSKITGTGENGAITKDDVEKAIAEQKEKQPETPIPVSENIRMAIAAAMSKSNREIPHYYLEIKIDMSKAMTWLAKTNKEREVKNRLLPVVLLIKATAKSLREVPDLNAVWENGLKRKNEINVGFAISLKPSGLLIPAIHDADKKSLDEIMNCLNDMIPRARELKLRSSELSDSTITLTSLGDGADKVFGVIYPPQVAIVGFGSISEQPFSENGMLGIRPVITATLAGDHRATDGHTGNRFLSALKNHLQNPETL